ncbi:transcription factor 24-like [Anguilla rostrata]|uniref:transcription factor 24-like n=1 Tax=Anguilla rostrata TaxID=7938 RepID=UPI0030CC6AC8
MAESRLGDSPSAGQSGAEGESRFGARGPQLGGGPSACRDSRKGVRSGSGGPKPQVYPANAARERSRVRNLRQAFHSLQAALPSVPPNTKLSKLDVLVLATNYIAHLTQTLDQGESPTERPPLCRAGGYLHPVKKWPMRSLLYCGSVGELLSGAPANQNAPSGEDDANPPAPDGEGHTEWSGQK